MFGVIKWSLWQRRWSTLIWTLSFILFIVLNVALYPSFKDQAAEMEEVFAQLPDAAVSLLGGSTDFFSPVGYMNSQVFFIMLPLLVGMLAISLGGKLLASEEQNHTIEALLARPVSRTKLLTGKAIAGFIILLVSTAATVISTIAVAKMVEIDVSTQNMVVVSLACFLLALSFGAIAFLLSAIGKTRVLSIGLAAGIAIGGYVISSLAGTVDWLELPSKIFPFEYYKSEAILNGTYDWGNLWILAAITVVCGILSWLAFRKRDIY